MADSCLSPFSAFLGGKIPFRHISRPFYFCVSKFRIFDFLRILFIFVNMGPYGRKSSNDILSESAQEICSPKFMHTPRKGL